VSAGALRLGPLSLPLWLILVVVAATRFLLNWSAVKKGVMPMTNKLNTILFTLTGFAEMVWDIGTKVAAAY
jgi:hypothetical protein